MERVGKFEKVSYEQFEKDCLAEYNIAKDDIRNAYDTTPLPVRATSGGAGYDLFSPITFAIRPGETFKLMTGVKAKIEDGWFLFGVPRSSLGSKFGIRFANTCMVIDSDYADNPSNEGHIMIMLTNGGNDAVSIQAGDRIAQGIFLPYGITYDDRADGTRTGGIGSTGK